MIPPWKYSEAPGCEVKSEARKPPVQLSAFLCRKYGTYPYRMHHSGGRSLYPDEPQTRKWIFSAEMGGIYLYCPGFGICGISRWSPQCPPLGITGSLLRGTGIFCSKCVLYIEKQIEKTGGRIWQKTKSINVNFLLPLMYLK